MATFVVFERKVRRQRIDVFMSDHHFLCDQKSVDIDFDKTELHRECMETPYRQAIGYAQHLPYSEHLHWLMTSSFEMLCPNDLN